MAIVPKPKGLNCPNCGYALEIRGLGRAITIVCPACLAALDASNPQLQIITEWQSKQRVEPLIPLGSRGTWKGVKYEVIGFQRRECVVDETTYFWDEYLLFNPYQGFRYLSEYNGHWNFITVIRALPSLPTGTRTEAVIGGQHFRHFQTTTASTSFVLGEFPWQVRAGESVRAADYIAPPLMLSSETADNEVTWSLSEYTNGADLWKAFGVKTAPPKPVGVFANQPSNEPNRKRQYWLGFLVMAGLLIATMFFFLTAAKRQRVLEHVYTFQGADRGEHSFVTEAFELKGHAANVQIDIFTDLKNRSAFFAIALINETTGQAWDFGRSVSYYTGSDSDGSYTEGSSSDSATLPSIPPGKYYLRVEPEIEIEKSTTEGTDAIVAPTVLPPAMHYSIRVTHDVPSIWYYFVALLFLILPPIWVSMRSGAFEARRWAESDYGTA
jgi:hypothetical protein